MGDDKITIKEIYEAEEQASARIEAEAYILIGKAKPEHQKSLFECYCTLMLHGERLLMEELLKIKNDNQNDT